MNNNKVFIVAEAGVNHNGSMEKALDLIDAAVYAGVDAIKFQTFKTENYVTKNASKADYQKVTTGKNESQFQMIKNLELSYDKYYKLQEKCEKNNIKFLSTAFDLESLNFLTENLKVDMLKIPSGEITNGPYLLAHAKCKKKLIVSTGMCDTEEIQTALGVIAFGLLDKNNPSKKAFEDTYESVEGKTALKDNVTLLHCTSNYPANFNEINLNAISEMKKKFNLPIGYSDHSKGILVSISAASIGAKYIEKHFTLDQNLPGPDHLASLEPDQLKTLVKNIRDVEVILGDFKKTPQTSEINNRKVVRRSIVAKKRIRKGELFSHQNITIKRPALGISPMNYWSLIGEKSTKDYEFDDIIK